AEKLLKEISSKSKETDETALKERLEKVVKLQEELGDILTEAESLNKDDEPSSVFRYEKKKQSLIDKLKKQQAKLNTQKEILDKALTKKPDEAKLEEEKDDKKNKKSKKKEIEEKPKKTEPEEVEKEMASKKESKGKLKKSKKSTESLKQIEDPQKKEEKDQEESSKKGKSIIKLPFMKNKKEPEETGKDDKNQTQTGIVSVSEQISTDWPSDFEGEEPALPLEVDEDSLSIESAFENAEVELEKKRPVPEKTIKTTKSAKPESLLPTMKGKEPEMAEKFLVLEDWKAEEEEDLGITKDSILEILEKNKDGWWLAKDETGKEGFVPSTLLQPTDKNAPPKTTEPDTQPSEDELESLEVSDTELASISDVPASKNSTLGKFSQPSFFKGQTALTLSKFLEPRCSSKRPEFVDISVSPVTQIVSV
ncbi:hypothetical protein Ciccas_000846, partial [Cichlidogyrus casuarinus]